MRFALLTGSDVPRPALNKAVGALNVIFGGMLYLCGLGCLNILGPSMAEYQPLKLEPVEAQEIYDQYRKIVIQKLETREHEATTAADKARFHQERLEIEARHPRVAEQFNWPSFNSDLLRVSWCLWADIATAPVLNLFMLASGIGLLQLKSWARTMAIWVASLKIARLVILSIVLAFVVFPSTSRILEALLSSDLGQVQQRLSLLLGENAPAPGDAALQAAETDLRLVITAFRQGTYVSAVLLFLGLVYPVTTLVILCRSSSRDACAPEEPPEE